MMFCGTEISSYKATDICKLSTLFRNLGQRKPKSSELPCKGGLGTTECLQNKSCSNPPGQSPKHTANKLNAERGPGHQPSPGFIERRKKNNNYAVFPIYSILPLHQDRLWFSSQFIWFNLLDLSFDFNKLFHLLLFGFHSVLQGCDRHSLALLYTA